MWVCVRSVAGIAGSNPASHGGLSLLSVMCKDPCEGPITIKRNPAVCVFVCVCVISKPERCKGLDPVGFSSQWGGRRKN